MGGIGVIQNQSSITLNLSGKYIIVFLRVSQGFREYLNWVTSIDITHSVLYITVLVLQSRKHVSHYHWFSDYRYHLTSDENDCFCIGNLHYLTVRPKTRCDLKSPFPSCKTQIWCYKTPISYSRIELRKFKKKVTVISFCRLTTLRTSNKIISGHETLLFSIHYSRKWTANWTWHCASLNHVLVRLFLLDSKHNHWGFSVTRGTTGNPLPI